MQLRPAAQRWLHARTRCTLSTVLQPFDQVPHNQQPKEGQAEEECVSSRLLSSYGIVRPAGPGTFSLLPLGLRAQHKLVTLIDEELGRVGCQRLALPSLTPASLWRRSGRLEGQGKELVRLTDRQGREVLLAPTHEETVTSMLAGLPVVTMAQLPLRLYQVGSKFRWGGLGGGGQVQDRDEMRPKFGLIRSCEFTMQDLYTFDCDEEAARRTYRWPYKAS
jgi:prolyl-tRNA synthetase